ncbi:NAD(P)-dependent alcohol dehydrogenase [Rhodococcus erythropolis]|uniref:NAD(P)-dependent alcohol dehydrogenase n=1 Tax=Rhodococcus erythropolis TaxID=1833 RepID=UPI00294A9559|nr:NAD(P)-dependent alcohol dehydrogenase [Rhodococcus erythropolis]MDV6278387.1 NAD(P)-dependent alcohol dehydrogenase [Rhodococcus erythropolis]
MIDARAYIAKSATASFEKTEISRRAVGPLDVLIDIKFVGICHSDIHTVRNEWGDAHYPIVPGHEITGVVSGIGASVTRYQVGDRVGVGCFVDSCGECNACRTGQEQYCTEGVIETYNSVGRDGDWTLGGYSTKIVVTEHFVVRIPDGLALDIAAPLLCAGITMYSPLVYWKAGPEKNLAIVGLGGVGHVGVQIAHAMGADVTVLSQSRGKEADSRRFGASSFYATSNPDTFARLRGKFDLIINTVSADIDINTYLELLAINGTLVLVGLPEKPVEIQVFELAANRRSIAGSMVGGIVQTQEMLDYCARHGIHADVQVVDAGQVEDIYEKIIANDVRYRYVIDCGTI